MVQVGEANQVALGWEGLWNKFLKGSAGDKDLCFLQAPLPPFLGQAGGDEVK